MDRTVGPIDALLRERHLLKHPFYVAWSAGELPLPTLRQYAGQYYRFESAFPRFVAAAYSQLERPEDRRVLLDNLVDEEGRPPTHPQLWLDFARGIGLSGRAASTAPPLAPTSALLDCYERLTRRSPAEAVSALYAYESIFPEIAAEKSRGLRAHYGVNSPAAHEFFRVHTTADVEHSGAERRVLSGLLEHSPAARKAALLASRRAIGAWWSFLDGFPLPMMPDGPRSRSG
ncbi:MAG TPA: CADD family putative folate metabolism protein [Thermoplasmata archaeon]|nr:CADD family putative folate metabolism protein [Thermoplasmata archaeon]